MRVSPIHWGFEIEKYLEWLGYNMLDEHINHTSQKHEIRHISRPIVSTGNALILNSNCPIYSNFLRDYIFESYSTYRIAFQPRRIPCRMNLPV